MNFSMNKFFAYLVLLVLNPVFVVAMELIDKKRVPLSPRTIYVPYTKQSASIKLMEKLSSFEPQDVVYRAVHDSINSNMIDFTIKNQFGKTALSYALTWPDTKIADAIAKAAPLLVDVRDKYGNTPLYREIVNKRLPHACCLIENGATLEVTKGVPGTIHALQIIVEQARGNKIQKKSIPVELGGGSWQITKDFVELVGSRSLLDDIKRVKKYVDNLIQRDSSLSKKRKAAYASNIVNVLNKMEKQKEKELNIKRKRSSDDGEVIRTQSKKRKCDSTC